MPRLNPATGRSRSGGASEREDSPVLLSFTPMAYPVPGRRIVRWLLPSAVGIVLLLLLPEPWWPLAFVPALAGMLQTSRRHDLQRSLTFGFVLACMSPILFLSLVTLVFYLVPSLHDALPPDWVVRLVLFLGWTLSAYNLWRQSLRPRTDPAAEEETGRPTS